MMKRLIVTLCVLGLIQASFAPPPVTLGDTCYNPIVISSLPYCDLGNNTSFLGDYDGRCVATLGGKDVVYSYTPTDDVTISASTCGSSFPTYLHVFTGCAAGMSEMACVTSGCPDFDGACLLSMPLTSGTTYFFVVDAQDDIDEGDYRFAIHEGDDCPDCDVILPVELISFTATGQNRRVVLNWSTASERNSDHFEILRDGRWITEIAAFGNSNTTREYTWIDQEVQNDLEYRYTLVSVDVNGVRQDLGTVDATPAFDAYAVAEYALHQNYPNPFNPTTTIRMDLVEGGFTTLRVFNLVGQEVRRLVSHHLPQGSHTALFDGTLLPSGVYVYQLDVNGYSAQKKMILMK